MVIRNLAQSGDTQLYAKNIPITSFKSLKIQQLIENLVDTMHDKNLIGLAAPQIRENYLIFVTHVRNTSVRTGTTDDGVRVFINPRITFLSSEKHIIYEGCGSIQEAQAFGPVERSKEIEVTAYDKNRKKISLRCDGLLARVILHEIDHLAGVLFTQKISNNERLLSTDEYTDQIKDSHSQKTAALVALCEYKELNKR